MGAMFGKLSNQSFNPIGAKDLNAFIPLLLLTIIISCSDDSGEDIVPPVVVPPRVEYVPTQLPEDTTELFVEPGPRGKDTVWIYVGGGPITAIGRNRFIDVPNNDRYHHIQVHQAQTYNQALKDSTLTQENVELETDVSVEMINRVIHYFKSREKMVVVFGNSYGGWLVLRYLSLFGSNVADKFVVTAARLNIESDVYNGFIGNIGYIFPDYVTPRIGGFQPRPGNTEDRLVALLRGVVGSDRNTQRLDTTDLTNMLFAYSIDDDLVGRLKQNEFDFLISKNVTIIESEGGHEGMWSSPYVEMIYEFTIR